MAAFSVGLPGQWQYMAATRANPVRGVTSIANLFYCIVVSQVYYLLRRAPTSPKYLIAPTYPPHPTLAL
ncbi:MAG TPA: hypothetical protein VH369_24340 [Bryobacteraceae bacterium]